MHGCPGCDFLRQMRRTGFQGRLNHRASVRVGDRKVFGGSLARRDVQCFPFYELNTIQRLASSKHLLVVLTFLSTLILHQPWALASSLVHFSTLPAHDPPPSERQCATMIARTPEVRPNNTPFNLTVPTLSELTEFYRNPFFPSFTRVTGNYRGSTDMILRWAACKWGIDEDVARAQAWTESKWRQGGPNPGDGGGDKRLTQGECVRGNFKALWNFGCDNCCYQSWGILQTKVYYAASTWPMIKDSTAFNADYRYADQRACMNGDYSDYFSSAAQQPNTYAADIASGDLNRILWGCIGMHFSGGWYTPPSRPYISEVQGYLTTRPWQKLAS